VVLKPWKRYFAGYISERKQQLNEREPWHMPFPIRYKTCFVLFIHNIQKKIKFWLLMWLWHCSGGQTVASILVRLLIALVKKVGVGAGQSVGSQHVLGKSRFEFSPPKQRNSMAMIKKSNSTTWSPVKTKQPWLNLPSQTGRKLEKERKTVLQDCQRTSLPNSWY